MHLKTYLCVRHTEIQCVRFARFWRRIGHVAERATAIASLRPQCPPTDDDEAGAKQYSCQGKEKNAQALLIPTTTHGPYAECNPVMRAGDNCGSTIVLGMRYGVCLRVDAVTSRHSLEAFGHQLDRRPLPVLLPHGGSHAQSGPSMRAGLRAAFHMCGTYISQWQCKSANTGKRGTLGVDEFLRSGIRRNAKNGERGQLNTRA